jgi:hypothetical protein
MWRIVLCCLVLLLLESVFLSRSCAQPATTDKKTTALQELRWREDQYVPPAKAAPSDGGHVPILEYILAVIGTLLVLLIVCMPSRKA